MQQSRTLPDSARLHSIPFNLSLLTRSHLVSSPDIILRRYCEEPSIELASKGETVGSEHPHSWRRIATCRLPRTRIRLDWVRYAQPPALRQTRSSLQS